MLSQLQSYASDNLFTVSGEWSNAVTDCAKWLNGRGVGARWDGTYQSGQQTFGSCDGWSGNMSSFSDDYKTFLRKYVTAPYSSNTKNQGAVYLTCGVSQVLGVPGCHRGGRPGMGVLDVEGQHWEYGFVYSCGRLTDVTVFDRLRTRMTGVTSAGWRAAGFRKTRRTGCTPTSAPKARSHCVRLTVGDRSKERADTAVE